MNLTNINITPLHIAFDEVCKKANERGLRVTGSELVGLVPLKCLTDAGKYFLNKQQRSSGVSEEELVRIAVKSLGLNELTPFDPNKKVIEYLLHDSKDNKLVQMNLRAFANETASESPAPGGGSIAAYLGSLSAALSTMVANLSSHKRGWDERWEYFSAMAEKGQELKDKLLKLVDEDTRAFNRIMDAFALPKSTDAEKKIRTDAIQEATIYATDVPMQTMRNSYLCFEIAEAMAQQGNPNSISDAGVGALCARSAVWGAYLNVCINAAGIKDESVKSRYLREAEAIKNESLQIEARILDYVEKQIAKG
jgi:glutamate formiminotransferase/formiminotetrahydrofolate cyclodeaminase